MITSNWLDGDIEESKVTSNYRYKGKIRRHTFDKFQVFENSLGYNLWIINIYKRKRGIYVQFILMNLSESFPRTLSISEFKRYCRVFPYNLGLPANDSRWWIFKGYANLSAIKPNTRYYRKS